MFIIVPQAPGARSARLASAPTTAPCAIEAVGRARPQSRPISRPWTRAEDNCPYFFPGRDGDRVRPTAYPTQETVVGTKVKRADARARRLRDIKQAPKSQRDLKRAAPTVCRHSVSGTLSLPSSGCFSPFPHGTCALSVTEEYLGLEGGPPMFRQDFTCPALLESVAI